MTDTAEILAASVAMIEVEISELEDEISFKRLTARALLAALALIESKEAERNTMGIKPDVKGEI